MTNEGIPKVYIKLKTECSDSIRNLFPTSSFTAGKIVADSILESGLSEFRIPNSHFKCLTSAKIKETNKL